MMAENDIGPLLRSFPALDFLHTQLSGRQLCVDALPVPHLAYAPGAACSCADGRASRTSRY